MVQQAFITATHARTSEAAASMAYYAFFSLFPMLLFLVVAGSFFLEKDWVYQEIMTFVRNFVPLIEPLIADNIGKIINLRGPVGLIGLGGLLWSATAFFAIMVRNIDRAWPHNRPRNLIEQRIFAIEVIGVVTVLLFASWVLNTAVNYIPKIIPAFDVKALGGVIVWLTIVPRLISWVTTWLFFYILYRYVPVAKVENMAALISSILAAIAMQATGAGIGWLFQKGLIRYDLVYGSLGTIALLMFWIYISGFIILYGAHLTSAIHRSRQIVASVLSCMDHE